MKVAVVGATGMVGEVMLKVLAERNFPITELLLVASERSVGKKLPYKSHRPPCASPHRSPLPTAGGGGVDRVRSPRR